MRLNAGFKVLKGDYPSNIDPEVLSETLAINVIGPAIVFREFVSLLEHSERPVVVNVTSGLGSISSTNSGAPASYSISKAALNMLTIKQAKEKPHFICLAMDPGWVKTGTFTVNLIPPS
ncbi:hypothetical protein Clacol_009237 [Clathrus columnatus]|uniref:Uncharacterized protein n=1 Tax=Clathrus columnatus TaxID=1419009 RepID=A0AAV5AML8_9AGAM|nr:hypothetical protein Clacol_009237 [Clathrus columnatus]